VPLILLAVPSAVIGWPYVEPTLFGGHFGDALVVLPEHDVLGRLASEWHGELAFVLHGLAGLPLWLALAGVATAWVCYCLRPELPAQAARRLRWLYWALESKYGFDRFNETVVAAGARSLGRLLWQVGDVRLIDGLIVNGSARAVGWFSTVVRHVQSGFLYHYAFAMIIGLFALITGFVFLRGGT